MVKTLQSDVFVEKNAARRKPLFRKKIKMRFFFFWLMVGTVAVDRVQSNIDETAS